MSSLNVVKQRDRVVLITDGAVYDMSTGIVQGFPAKISEAEISVRPGDPGTAGAGRSTTRGASTQLRVSFSGGVK